MSADRTLPQATRRVVGKVLDELGRANRVRVEALLKLPVVGDRIRLSDVLAVLFPQAGT